MSTIIQDSKVLNLIHCLWWKWDKLWQIKDEP